MKVRANLPRPAMKHTRPPTDPNVCHDCGHKKNPLGCAHCLNVRWRERSAA